MSSLSSSHLFALALACFFPIDAAIGQAFPSKPVTLIVTAAPGGNADVEARRWIPKLTRILGQPFLLDFKLGGGGTIGAGYVARSLADGHTLLAATGSFTTFPAFYSDLPFDTINDFSPISFMSQRATVMMVSPSFPAQNFLEYVDYAKANPGKINFATSGSGGVIHLAAAWLHSATNTRVTYIHYKGQAPALTDLIAGRVDVATGPAPTALSMMKAGRIRVLAIMGNRHSKVLPGIRNVAEQGIPEYDYSSWHGYLAPGNTPVAVVNKLAEAFALVAKDAELVKLLDAEGVTLVGNSPSEFRQFIIADTNRWRKIVAENRIKSEE